jgi:hypothetical protein
MPTEPEGASLQPEMCGQEWSWSQRCLAIPSESERAGGYWLLHSDHVTVERSLPVIEDCVEDFQVIRIRSQPAIHVPRLDRMMQRSWPAVRISGGASVIAAKELRSSCRPHPC